MHGARPEKIFRKLARRVRLTANSLEARLELGDAPLRSRRIQDQDSSADSTLSATVSAAAVGRRLRRSPRQLRLARDAHGAATQNPESARGSPAAAAISLQVARGRLAGAMPRWRRIPCARRVSPLEISGRPDRVCRRATRRVTRRVAESDSRPQPRPGCGSGLSGSTGLLQAAAAAADCGAAARLLEGGDGRRRRSSIRIGGRRTSASASSYATRDSKE